MFFSSITWWSSHTDSGQAECPSHSPRTASLPLVSCGRNPSCTSNTRQTHPATLYRLLLPKAWPGCVAKYKLFHDYKLIMKNQLTNKHEKTRGEMIWYDIPRCDVLAGGLWRFVFVLGLGWLKSPNGRDHFDGVAGRSLDLLKKLNKALNIIIVINCMSMCIIPFISMIKK